MKRIAKLGLVAAALAAVWGTALADITVGVVVSATGPAASLGIPEKNTVALMPQTMGGQKVNYVILDDASDTTAAVSNTRKLVSENKADIIIGSSTTPNSLAMIDVVSESKTPMITLGASARIIEPMDDKKKWVFKTPQNDSMMAGAIADHMAKSGVKTVASGGVKSLDDIRAVKALEKDGIEGVIAGKSIYTGTLDLAAAIAFAAQED